MGIKGLRVAHEQLGSERDPNAPHNRPKFLDHDAAPAHAAGGNMPGQRLGQEEFSEGQEVRSTPLALTPWVAYGRGEGGRVYERRSLDESGPGKAR